MNCVFLIVLKIIIQKFCSGLFKICNLIKRGTHLVPFLSSLILWTQLWLACILNSLFGMSVEHIVLREKRQKKMKIFKCYDLELILYLKCQKQPNKNLSVYDSRNFKFLTIFYCFVLYTSTVIISLWDACFLIYSELSYTCCLLGILDLSGVGLFCYFVIFLLHGSFYSVGHIYICIITQIDSHTCLRILWANLTYVLII